MTLAPAHTVDSCQHPVADGLYTATGTAVAVMITGERRGGPSVAGRVGSCQPDEPTGCTVVAPVLIRRLPAAPVARGTSRCIREAST